ncbi:nitroreductase family deazaflavin-dependent oxidoreductase [Nonomuraea sp. NPDC050783]|uniref:nitroreductase family deazaflavin-dependent oxidoreductase n=1 Tax=Nonomuraea sp. NPDC050783 TaxID=3154634 RepID=UPI003467BF9E
MTGGPVGVRGVSGVVTRGLAALKRAMYPGSRPGAAMRLINQLDVLTYGSRRLSPRHGAVLKVAGRRSGDTTSVPVVVTALRDAEFLVSMLGPEANWVRNVRAAGGRATLRRVGRETPILLEEVPVEHRAEILRRYLTAAPGARPHLRVGPAASPAELRRIAPRHPVFRIRERPA